MRDQRRDIRVIFDDQHGERGRHFCAKYSRRVIVRRVIYLTCQSPMAGAPSSRKMGKWAGLRSAPCIRSRTPSLGPTFGRISRHPPVVSDCRAADSAAGRRGRDRAAAPGVGGMPVAVLGQPGAGPGDVGDRRRRLVGRRAAARHDHVMARMARRLRALRRRRAAAGAARAAASRAPRESHRHHRGRHRRHRGADRLPLLALRRRLRSGAWPRSGLTVAAAALRGCSSSSSASA